MSQAQATESTPHSTSDGVYELFILALTIYSLLMVAVYYLLPLSEASKQTLLWLDVPISLIFLADSLRSLRRAPNKRAYLKWGWLDFLGSIPLIFPLRIARLGRLIRAWRVVRTRRPSHIVQDLDQNRAQGAALITVFLVIVVLTVATAAVLQFESEVPEANIRSGHDAIWWSIVTMATVGYGDFYPITTGGRIAAMALMTVGIGIYGMLASYLAHLFLPKAPDDDGSPDLSGIKVELAAVNTRLDAIEAMLRDRAPPRPGDSGTEPG